MTSILVGPAPDTIFAGTLEGVYRSQDNGLSWHLKSSGLSGASVKTLERSGRRLLCGTTSGLFFSEDNGDIWSACGEVPSLEILSIKANPSLPDEVVAANLLSGYFFVSQDGGLSWDTLELGASLSKVSSFAFTSAGDLIAGTATEGVLRLVLRPLNRFASVEEEPGDQSGSGIEHAR